MAKDHDEDDDDDDEEEEEEDNFLPAVHIHIRSCL